MASAPEARRVSREWPVWKTVTDGEKPALELAKRLKAKGMLPATKWMGEFLGSLLKTKEAAGPLRVNLARVALVDIDFFDNQEPTTFSQAIMRAAEYGLSVFSLQVAFLARLGYEEQPKGETLTLATPMEDANTSPCSFKLVNDPLSGIAIEPLYVMPEMRFPATAEFVFKIP